ncbi:isocitrate lyase/phosphoenolpyruvate mutase family protein [Actinocatenispora sera]|uniref:isocitrate lyase/PEP mutase family protein n=1 Tax=Actinocatenispora sera TaxID=390989 RepID=UPI0034077045
MKIVPTGAGEPRAAAFLQQHVPGRPVLMPNAWDVASAACLTALGFEAIGTSSAAVAATLGAADGAAEPTRMYESAAAIAGAVAAPVSADFEDGYAAAGVAVDDLVARSVAAGLAGISLEDCPRVRDEPPYPVAEASRRIRAAAQACAGRLVLTGRADGRMRDPDADLGEIIARLVAYEEAGAAVLFAPAVTEPAELRRILDATTVPLSVMWMPGAPSIAELADLGVARVSLGPFPMYAAYAGLAGLRDALATDAATFSATAAAGADLLTRALGG